MPLAFLQKACLTNSPDCTTLLCSECSIDAYFVKYFRKHFILSLFLNPGFLPGIFSGEWNFRGWAKVSDGGGGQMFPHGRKPESKPIVVTKGIPNTNTHS